MVLLIIFALIAPILARDENVLMSEVFEIVVNPPMFNWTYEGNSDQFVYSPSLHNAPDLPSWISYVFSRRHHCGYLFGVPPSRHRSTVRLEIVALNRKTYETRHELVNVRIQEKLNHAKYEVHMKIDNLNVDDMFDIDRMDRLKDIYRKNLWKDSESDIYVTFLTSALKMGARRPANPSQSEGVVLRLGSQSPFSNELVELQEEVRPLWKISSCPRDFKRTTVERFFRNEGFAMDWCAFRLIEENNSALHQFGTNEKMLNSVEYGFGERWEPVARESVPVRSYFHETLFTILVPMIVLVLLSLALSIILCFHHEGISKRMEDAPLGEITQYATIQRATHALRSLSNNREMTLSPDTNLLSQSHTNSPTSTISRGVHCRPSPPPYVRPKFKPEM